MKLTTAQQNALEISRTADKPIAWLGSIRAGKTFGSCHILFDRMKKYPGNYIIAGYTYGNLERNVMPVMEEVLEANHITDWKLRHGSPKCLEIETYDSRAYLFSAKDTESQKMLQGMTARGAFIDEVLLMPQNFIMQTIGRLSIDPPFLLMTANKEAPNHWIKTQWIDKGKVIEINSRTEDNPYISKTSLNWYENLLEGHYKQKMFGNEWCAEFNAVSGMPNWIHESELPKADSLTRYYYCAFITYARECTCLYSYIKDGKLYIYNLLQADATEILQHMQEKQKEGATCIVNYTETDSPAGFQAFSVDIPLWAESQKKLVDNSYIDLDLKDYLANIGAWIYKDDAKPDEISTDVLSLALLIHATLNRLEPFSIKGKLL